MLELVTDSEFFVCRGGAILQLTKFSPKNMKLKKKPILHSSTMRRVHHPKSAISNNFESKCHFKVENELGIRGEETEGDGGAVREESGSH